MKTIRAAMAVLMQQDGSVLAVPQANRAEVGSQTAANGDAEREPDDDRAAEPRCWEFPTAELRRGESAESACARAIREQTGLEATTPRAFYTIEYNGDGERLLSLECFLCELADASAAAGRDEPVGTGTSAAADEPAPTQSEVEAPNLPAALELRWVPRSELPALTWSPTSAELARVVATSDAEGDQKLIKRRADSRRSMQGNKRANTKPELLVRERLRAAGLPGYRLQWKKAPGRPDIAYPGRKVAIFVNGCYWHRCPLCNPRAPKRNAAFWEAKFARNVERDAKALAELEELGWTAITIWECQLKKDAIDATMEQVVEQVRAAQPRRSKHGSSRA